MNTRYRIRFQRPGIIYGTKYAPTIERARRHVHAEYQKNLGTRWYDRDRPTGYVIEGTRDYPRVGQHATWTAVEWNNPGWLKRSEK